MTAAALSPSRSGLGRGADRRPAYGDAGHAALTPRQAEYRVFANVTHRLNEAQAAVDAGETGAYGRLAAAAHDNLRLWLTLAADLAVEENGLPAALRAGLLSLAAYVERETPRLVKREISAASLVEINATVMKGLRGQVEGP